MLFPELFRRSAGGNFPGLILSNQPGLKIFSAGHGNGFARI